MRRLAFASISMLLALSAHAQIKGAGATFPGPVYVSWGSSYEKDKKIAVSYSGVGSGEGVKQIVAGTVDFGATDVPLPQADLVKFGLVQFPTLVGGIVPAVNLPGVRPGQLHLSGTLLSQIFSGKVASWNDPAIHALNPGVVLPRLAIKRIVREDSSGTTASFTTYLAKADSAWPIGSGLLVNWPGTVTTAKGNGGVAEQVASTPGAIGYVAFDLVRKLGLNYASLQNKNGQFVAPSEESFVAAIRNSPLARGQEAGSLTDMSGNGVWPLTETTYILIPRKPKDAQRAQNTLKFFYWVFLQGDAMADGTGFAALPAMIQARIVGRFREVEGPDGRPLDFF